MEPKTRILDDKDLLNILALSADATAIYTSENITIEMANDAMLAFWGKGREVIGLPLYDAVPELQGQPFMRMLQEVLRTGATDSGVITAETRMNGHLQTNYFEYEYRAIKDGSGQPYAILHRASNVTERENRKLNLRLRDEQIRQLKEKLEASNEALRKSYEDLIDANDKLENTNIQVSQLNDELTTFVIEQKRNDQRKNDFISMVSHELKTPLTSLNSCIQVLQRKILKDDDQLTVNMLELAHSQVRKMTSLINGFLNVSRLESGKIHIERSVFDLSELIRCTEEETRLHVSSHSLLFTTAEPVMVYADKDKIGHVLSNLISNAVKYSPPGSTIEVHAQKQDGQAVVSVKDEGIGVSREDIPRLFERYFRASRLEGQQISGFGIGLYLCKEIVERHGGRIWAESELGLSAQFYFTLPLYSSGI